MAIQHFYSTTEGSLPVFEAKAGDKGMPDFIKSILESFGGSATTVSALLLVLAGLVKGWHMMLGMKKDAAKAEAERRQETERLANRLREDTERNQREERERLTEALENARAERNKEMDDKLHHLRTKMQVYEYKLAIQQKTSEMEKRDRAQMAEELGLLRKQLEAANEENLKLRQRSADLQKQVTELERQLEVFRKQMPGANE